MVACGSQHRLAAPEPLQEQPWASLDLSSYQVGRAGALSWGHYVESMQCSRKRREVRGILRGQGAPEGGPGVGRGGPGGVRVIQEGSGWSRRSPGDSRRGPGVPEVAGEDPEGEREVPEGPGGPRGGM